jgi:hypothetical protein
VPSGRAATPAELPVISAARWPGDAAPPRAASLFRPPGGSRRRLGLR